jgi:hypothetical protein
MTNRREIAKHVDELEREQIMARAIKALTTSIESIKAAGGDDVDEAIAESVGQCKRFLEKNLADLAVTERGDEGDPDDEGADELDDGDDDEAGNDHHASKVADLLVESGSHSDRASALQHLLHTKDGRALLDRLHKGESKTMNTEQHLEGILKDFGPVKLCKHIVEKGKAPCNEHELVAGLTKHAAEQFKLPGDRAFAKLYAEEIDVRKAIAVAKAMPIQVDFAPVQTSTPRAFQDAVSDTESSEAYRQLVEIGKQRWPTATEAQAFSRAMTAPENAELAAKALKRPGPNDWNQFPR